jgi:hypothetical protein
MAVHSRQINSAGGQVDVDIHAGHRHILNYRLVLMDGDGSNQQTILSGDTVDTLPDRITLPMAASALSGKFLALVGVLAPVVASGVAQNFNIDVSISQNGALIGGSPVSITGTFTSAIPVLEHIGL